MKDSVWPSILSVTTWCYDHVIVSAAAILCEPKEITVIQQEVYYLSFLPSYPECLNPAVGMSAFHFAQFHLQHHLNICFPMIGKSTLTTFIKGM